MQRFTSLIIICFLALFFCTIAYTIQQDASFYLNRIKRALSLPKKDLITFLKKERRL